MAARASVRNSFLDTVGRLLGSVAAAIGLLRLIPVPIVGTGNIGQPGGRPFAIGHGAMPAAGGGSNQIAVGDGDQLFALHQELLGAFDDQPDFRKVAVIMAPHIVGRRGHALLGAQDGDIVVVVAQPHAALLAALHDLFFEIDIGNVGLAVIIAMPAIDGLDVLHAF